MANVLVNEASLTAIANAIRSKNGSSDTYLPSEMAVAISAISGGGITPTGTINITTNGTHDVTNYASASVAVPTSGTTFPFDFFTYTCPSQIHGFNGGSEIIGITNQFERTPTVLLILNVTALTEATDNPTRICGWYGSAVCNRILWGRGLGNVSQSVAYTSADTNSYLYATSSNISLRAYSQYYRAVNADDELLILAIE